MINIQTIFIMLGLASLSIEIADSILSNKIKKWLCLASVNKTVTAFSLFRFYFKYMPSFLLTLLGIPIIFFIILINIYITIVELLKCPICISFWMGFLYGFLINNYDIMTAIIFGGITIIFTRLIDKFLLL